MKKEATHFSKQKEKKVWHDLCGCVQFFRLGSYFWAEGIPLFKKKRERKKEKALLCENTDHFHITTTCSTTELVTVDSGTVGY